MKTHVFYKTAVLWALLILFVAGELMNALLPWFFGSQLTQHEFWYWVRILLPFTLLLLHSAWTLTYLRAICFITLSFFIGYVFEVVGLSFGTFFGGHYIYNQAVYPLIFFGVPLVIPIFWSIFIYIGYSISTSFIIWFGVDRPNYANKSLKNLILLIALDGIIVTAIDVLMDPVMVTAHKWAWLAGGAYHGIPVGNFFGWFTVTITAMTVFRIFEYYYPQSTHIMRNSSVFVMPIIAYALLMVIFIVSAIQLGLVDVALIGFFVMFPIILINFLFFVQRKIQRPS